MMSARDPPPSRLRRNGKQQACEPCRISRLRCDHNSPCDRCSRLGKMEMCIFHPAPMTRRVHSTSVSPNPPSTATSSTVVSRPKATVTRKPPTSTSTSTPTIELINPMALKTGGVFSFSTAENNSELGYMGSTGHSAILLENKIHGYTDLRSFQTKEINPAMAEPSRVNIDNFGSAILAWLPSRAVAEATFERYYQFANCGITCHRPTMIKTHQLFWDTFGHLADTPKDPANLRKLSEMLCKNTSVAFPVPSSNAEYLASFTGTNTRWDAIGLMFITYSSCAFFLPAHDPLLSQMIPEGRSRKAFCISLLECADACYVITDELCPSNLLSITLLARCVTLQSQLTGDTSLSLWSRIGSVIATVTAFGLHRQTEPELPCSTLYVEQRKHTFLSAYTLSVTIACFTGRPPPLTCKWISIPSPLDVHEHDLDIYDMDTLRRMVDENGWNKAGALYPASNARLSMWAILERDEILELSLVQMPPEVASQRVRDLRARMESAWSTLPKILKTLISKESIKHIDQENLPTILGCQVDRWHHLFLLERINYPERDEYRYLDAAAKTLKLVILYWAERERIPDHSDGVHWMIACYGISAASALGIDLLKSTSHAAKPSKPFRRSEVIQDLSVFVVALDWVRPTDGNYILCGRVKKMLEHILDLALSPSTHEADSIMYFPEGFDLDGFSTTDVPTFGTELDSWFKMGDWNSTPYLWPS